MKKLTTLLIALALMLGIFPLSAWADEDDEIEIGIEIEVDDEDEADEQGVIYSLSADGSGYIVTDFDDSYGSNRITIPVTFNDKPVVGIGDEAFSGEDSITKMNIGESVTYIGDHAFDNCKNLKTVTLGTAVVSVGDSAFRNCGRLNGIDIPESVTRIGANAFSGCAKLMAAKISDSVAYIGDSAFEGCALNTIAIPEHTVLGSHLFDNCENLEFIVENNMTYIGTEDNPYQILYSVGDISAADWEINPLTKQIAGSAFKECKFLQNITIPSSVISIGDYAFEGCSDLQYIVIPETVEYIGKRVFVDCDGLKHIYCAAAEQPDGWATSLLNNPDCGWNSKCDAKIHWDADEPIPLPDDDEESSLDEDIKDETSSEGETSFEDEISFEDEASTDAPSVNQPDKSDDAILGEDDNEDENDDHEKGNYLWILWILLAVAVVSGTTAVLIIVLKRKEDARRNTWHPVE